MHLRELHLQRVMRHDKTTLRLPECGIVVVTGDNGAGKSTFMEAMPAAIWNKTLRGTPWYRQGEASELVALVDDALIKRWRKKGKNGVEWSAEGEEVEAADNATKAQPALDARFGSFEAWRRTRVFSSQDADHFSTATDRQRKELLEGMLGLDRFGPALKRCRADVKALRSELTEKEKEAAVTAAKIKEREDALQRAKEAELGPEPKEIDEEHRKNLRERLRDLTGRRDAQTQHLRELQDMRTELRAKVEASRERSERFKDGKCPTCERKLTKKLEDAARRELAESKAALDKQEQEIATFVEESEKMGATYSEHIVKIKEELQGIADAEKDRERWLAKAKRVQELLSAEMDKIGQLRASLLDTEDECDELRADVELHEAAEKALGLRGIRAHVLERATKGVEEVANLWLARLFPGVSLRLGGDSDRLELEVEGLEHPFGYRGASGGERRRIDIALLLALAEVSAGALGTTTSGTLFFDEVMDTLDAAGIEGATEVLAEMASDRVVFVITHNREVAQRLPAAERIHVVDGVIA